MSEDGKTGQLSTRTRESLRMPKLVGLTGGIASGKSTVAQFLAEAGIPVLDADRISRELSSEGGAAYPTIVKRFGTADRAKLRELVFTDARARRDLEAILHPLILAESLKRACALAESSGSDLVVYEATLLIEAGRAKQMDGVIVVEAGRENQKSRLIAREGTRDQSTAELAEKILAAQSSDEDRRKHATWVIENTGSLGELRTKVNRLAEALRTGRRPQNAPERI